MAFPSDITLVDDAVANVVYSQISLEKGKSIRQDSTRDLGTPRSLTISHQVSGTGMKATDRHLVRLDLVEEDTGSDTIATVSGSVYAVLECPRRIVTAAMIKDMLTQLTGFLVVEANVDKLLNSEP